MSSIYVLGDSHTQALGPRIKTRFPEHSVRVEAFPGYSTDRAHGKASIPYGQDLVVLSLGGNDFGDKTAARKNLVAALQARNPGAEIVWFGPFAAPAHPTVGPRHDQQAEAQRRQLPLLGVRWYDTRPWSKTGHRADNVHFTASGYTNIADAMTSRIQDSLKGDSVFRKAETGGNILWTLAAAGGALWWLLRD